MVVVAAAELLGRAVTVETPLRDQQALGARQMVERFLEAREELAALAIPEPNSLPLDAVLEAEEDLSPRPELEEVAEITEEEGLDRQVMITEDMEDQEEMEVMV